MIRKIIILSSLLAVVCIVVGIQIQKTQSSQVKPVAEERFFHAAYLGQVDVVKSYIEKGTNPNSINGDGKQMTALMSAAWGGKVDVIRYLLSKGADINYRKKFGVTALMLAAHANNENAVNALLEGGADSNLNDERENTALIFAIRRENLNIVKRLANEGMGLQQKGHFGRTPLMIAAAEGKLKSLRTILAMNSGKNHINDVDSSKRTALMLATKEGRVEVIRELLSNNPNVVVADIQGKTVLDLAEQLHSQQGDKNRSTIINLLRAKGVKRGTPPVIPNYRINTPQQALRANH